MNVLVLCTGNSCRSILAEVLFNDLSAGRIQAFSAGSHPAGAVNPAAIRKLQQESHPTTGLASKSWQHFTGELAARIDIVITVCDSAAGESCPLWTGSPVTVHWGIADPADASPDASEAAFDRSYEQLRSRIEQTLAVPLESTDPRHLQDALQRIHDACKVQEKLRYSS